jgi:hypothetical protein
MAIQKIKTNIIEDSNVTESKIDSAFVTSINTNPQLSGTGSLKIPVGTTGQRPASPAVGMLRYNTTTGYFETYSGSGWGSIATPPAITTVTPSTYNGESGTSFTINGSFFDSSATVKFITSGGTEYTAATVSYVNSGQLTATTPQDFTVANEPLSVKVLNGSGLNYTLSSAIDCGGSPTWVTTAGSLGSFVEGAAVSTSVSATDPDTSATIAYSVSTGALPSGVSLNTSTGAITGTAPAVSSDTTYNFTLAATDNAGNISTRAFSTVITNQAYTTSSLWYDFDAADLSGTYANGASISGTMASRTAAAGATTTAGGTPLYSTTAGGNINLNGATGYFRITSATDWATLNNAPSISLVTWMQGNAASRQVVVSRYGTGAPNQFNHIVDPGGNYHWNSGGTGVSPSSGDLAASPTWPANTWFLSVWTYSVSDGIARWYQNNGTQAATVNCGTAGGNGMRVSSGATGTIGFGTRADIMETLNGRIAIARIYTKSLSVGEIQQEYASFRSRFGL